VQKLKKRKESGNRNVRKRNRKGEAKKSKSHCILALSPQSGGAVSGRNTAVDAVHESSQLRRKI
jgi:hypothetical protein